MTWWLWLIIAYWLVAGSVNAWYWQLRGDGILMFAIRFATGFVIILMMAIIFLEWGIQSRKLTRQIKKDLRAIYPS